jgi:hypothetical protein
MESGGGSRFPFSSVEFHLSFSRHAMPPIRESQRAQRAKKRNQALLKRSPEVRLSFPEGPPTTLTQRLAMSWMSRSVSDHVTMGTISNLIVEFIFKDRLGGSTPEWSMVPMQFTENASIRALCLPNRIEKVVFWIVRRIRPTRFTLDIWESIYHKCFWTNAYHPDMEQEYLDFMTQTPMPKYVYIFIST